MTGQSRMPRPLEGLRVLDLTVALSGPYGTQLLAGLGAEVIKIEPPVGRDFSRNNPPFYGKDGIHLGVMQPDDVSLSTLARSRSKKSVTLDLKSDEGRTLFHRLAQDADVVFENMSDGVVDRLGVGYEAISKVNPRIVYCSLTGLGRPSVAPGVKAMDITIQALSGLMDTTGEEDGPPTRVGVPLADLVSPLYLVIGMQAALRQRDVSGVGQHVVVSMLECIASLLPYEHFDVFRRNGFPARTGNHHVRLTPFGVYRTSDGHVSIAASQDGWAALVFDAMGMPELSRDPRFATRGPRARNADELNALIEDWTSRHTSDEVLRALHEERGVTCVRVRTALESLSDPALFAAGTLVKLHHPVDGEIDAVGAGVPIHMSGATVGLDRPAPLPGTHTDEVLGSLLGLDAGALAELRVKGVV